ncbi:MAG: mechanosensitive ion channel family protein [Balneolaceae bacterium]|nr:mechanosensitive ion channel family protein [Balneolaceae bacterium]
MNRFLDLFEAEINRLIDFSPTLLYSLAAFLIFFILGKIVSLSIDRILSRERFSGTHRLFFKNIVKWFIYLIGLIFALNIMGFQGITTSILASGGITAIVLGFAFRDIGENIMAGFFLAFNRPFNVGDLIISEGLEGRVKEVELRYTHIRTLDGCDIYIPSSQIFSKPLHNYTQDGLRRVSFSVGIDYHDDIEQALRLMFETVKEMERVLTDPAPAVNISGFNTLFIELQVMFWIDTYQQEQFLLEIKTRAMKLCRDVLVENGFTFSSGVTSSVDLKKVSVELMKQSDQ